LGTYSNESFGLESLKNPQNFGDEGLKRFDTVAVDHKNHDRIRNVFDRIAVLFCGEAE
jgi:hypothetical protein